MTARIGDAVPKRVIKHAHGFPLIEVYGHVGCYVRIQATPDHKGEKAAESFMLLTPAEARQFAYDLRVVADQIAESRDRLHIDGSMR